MGFPSLKCYKERVPALGGIVFQNEAEVVIGKDAAAATTPQARGMLGHFKFGEYVCFCLCLGVNAE